jgi:hypothetical protein
MSLQNCVDSRHGSDDEGVDFWPDVVHRPITESNPNLVTANAPQRVFFEFGLIVAVMLALALAANFLIPGP